MMACPRCAGTEVKKDGRAGEAQRYRCRGCRRTFLLLYRMRPTRGYRTS
jgi:transposase-like protein